MYTDTPRPDAPMAFKRQLRKTASSYSLTESNQIRSKLIHDFASLKSVSESLLDCNSSSRSSSVSSSSSTNRSKRKTASKYTLNESEAIRETLMKDQKRLTGRLQSARRRKSLARDEQRLNYIAANRRRNAEGDIGIQNIKR